MSIKYTERLAQAGIKPSVGSKVELLDRCGPQRSFEAVGYATLEQVEWWHDRRVLEPIGNIPPAEAEDQYDAAADKIVMAAWLIIQRPQQPGTVHFFPNGVIELGDQRVGCRR